MFSSKASGEREPEPEPQGESLYVFMADELEGGQQQQGQQDSSQWMDPELWSRLPEDVIALVLMKLPVLSHFRFMCVCRRWRVMLSDTGFAKLCYAAVEQETASGPPSCLCGMASGSGPPAAEIKIPGSSLRPHRFHRSSLPADPADPAGPGQLDLWASDRGLLCFSKRKQPYGEAHLYVCNPVTRSWKKLPPARFDQFESPHRAFLQVLDPGHAAAAAKYEVVLLAKTLAGGCCVFVYAAGARRWRRLEWEEVSVPASGAFDPVLSNGVLHVLGCSSGSDPSKRALSSFCVRSKREVAVPAPPAARCRKLVELHGCLFIVSFVEPFAGLSVWKLEDADPEKKLAAAVWTHVSTCSVQKFAQLTGSCKPPLLAKVGAVGGFICLCIDNKNGSSALQHTMAFCTRDNSWCVWDFGIADPRRSKLLPFQPTLTTSVTTR